jgi:hypothetical protein
MPRQPLSVVSTGGETDIAILYGERIVVLKVELEIWGTSLTVGSARRRLGVDYAVMRRVLAAEL